MKLQLKIIIITFLFVFTSYSTHSFACLSFSFKSGNDVIVAQSYEWMDDEGLIVVNKHGVKKRAIIAGKGESAEWVSRYGSVTFNQYGLDMPSGGMNERGLTISALVMLKPEGGNKTPDWYEPKAPVVNETQWVQYHLDNYATVNEVVADSDVELAKLIEELNLHYFVCDALGECAVIEYFEGYRAVHYRASMGLEILNNYPYDSNLSIISDYETFGGAIPIGDPKEYGPKYEGKIKENSFKNTLGCMKIGCPNPILDRYADVANRLNNYSKDDTSNPFIAAFRFMGAVEPIPWQIVYDPRGKRIYFRTKSFRAIRYIDMDLFDYYCNTPIESLNVNFLASGRINDHFTVFSKDENANLIISTFKTLRNIEKVSKILPWVPILGYYYWETLNIPDGIEKSLINYPDQIVCTY